MNDVIKYAKSLQKRFNLPDVDTSQLTGSEETTWQVVSKILDKPLQIQWLKEEKEDTKQLRQKFNLKPFDKFDKEADELIAQLEESR